MKAGKSVHAWPKLLTMTKLREMYLNDERSPEEVMTEILKRVKQEEHRNIWITPPTMERVQPYLKRLRSLDRERYPLWGIPFAIKDNIDLAGVPTTAACPKYTYIPEKSATVVERLIAAGAIPLGKTNLDQFATGLVGTRSPYGETKNTWKEELISGGSSSGSAVAVACGQAAFALGTDTAGSGRVPAALNRIIGLKPSRGAWPTTGIVPACASLDCVTVFANEWQDVLEIDHIVRGEDDHDPWSRRFPQLKPQIPSKIYLPKQPLDFFGPYREPYREAWDKAVEKLKQFHLPIDYIDYDWFAEAASLLYEGPWVAERWADLGDFVQANAKDVFPVTEKVLASGASTERTAVKAFQAMHSLQSIQHQVRKQLKDAVLVLPTCGGTWTREQVRKNPIETNNELGKYTNHCNLLDLSAIAIPAEDAEENVPFGVTIFSLAQQEGLLLGLAARFLDEDVSDLNEADGAFGEVLNIGEGYPSDDGCRIDRSRYAQKDDENSSKTTYVAVCGLHMRGFALESEMHRFGAKFVYETTTAPLYRLYNLPTDPHKPGLVRTRQQGASIQVEVWEMPISSFGAFTASIPAPLSMGTVELSNGNQVPGFVCEAYITDSAEDITAYGGWRSYCHREVDG